VEDGESVAQKSVGYKCATVLEDAEVCSDDGTKYVTICQNLAIDVCQCPGM